MRKVTLRVLFAAATIFATNAAFAQTCDPNDLDNKDCPISGFKCVGAYTSEAACNQGAFGDDDCLGDANRACADHGGLASHNCDSCAAYTAPGPGTEFSCPEHGQPTGWYVRLWYYCNAR